MAQIFPSSSAWTRKDSTRLGEIAMQAGFADIESAESALMIGARIKAHGFTDYEVGQMIHDQYRKWAEEGHVHD